MNRARVVAAGEILDKAYDDQIALHFKELCYQIAAVRAGDLPNQIDRLVKDFRNSVGETILAYERAHESLKDMLKP